LDAVASLRLYEALVPALHIRSADINAPIPMAWYSFNSKLGEPTRKKLAHDGREIPWKTSDCTWYAGGKFVGYPCHTQAVI
jgi:hypothetical protein